VRRSSEQGAGRHQLIIRLCLLPAVLGGCAGVDPPAGLDVEHSASPVELSTHRGIHELKTDDDRFVERADGLLTEGSGNPPHGWGNPSQSGQPVVSDDVAVFTDELGHREEFRVREGATSLLRICA